MPNRGPIIIVGIVIALIFVSPFGLGLLAESNVRHEIDVLNQYPPTAIEIVSYDRGWFGSQAKIEIRPASAYANLISGADPMMAALLDQFVLPFDVELSHGPIQTMNGFGIGSYALTARLNSEAAWAEQAMTTLGIPYIFELRGRSAFGPSFSFEGEIPAFDFTEDGATVTFSGLEFTGETDGERVTFESGIDVLELQSPFMSFIFEGFGVDADSSLNLSTIAPGTGQLSLDRFVLSNPLLGSQPVASIEGLSVTGTNSLNAADNYEIEALYSIDSFSAQGTPTIADAAIGVNVGNLNRTAVDQLYASMGEMYAGTIDPAMLGFTVLPYLSDILGGGPTLSIDPLRFVMDGERAEGRISMSIDVSALPTGGVMDLTDPAAALAAMNADADLTISKELLRTLMKLNLRQQLGNDLAGFSESQIDAMLDQQVEPMIAMVVLPGILVEDGDNYTTTIHYEGGIATVNGTPMPLSALGF